MLKSAEIQRRQSEIRQTLSELVGKDKPTDEELRNIEAMDLEFRNNETRYRAALIAEDEERAEAGKDLETRSDKEYADLIGRFEMRQVALSSMKARRCPARLPRWCRNCAPMAAIAAFQFHMKHWKPARAKRWHRARLPRR